ncbi:hypothetical protein OV079_40260 [Nannocystis pusilla]|uniref:Uncharacterized protein n=1 Tax=Nannocystis pusilla TaxID=889268 RepID=A0A9X3EY37_9BACT|nr:hypothetical protein [Nannocystis pusilla]MCY1011694.1 hypothetical protein [Nannocystis pusilla]
MLSMAGVAGALALLLLLEASFVVLGATAGVGALLMAIVARRGAERRSRSLPEANSGLTHRPGEVG